MTAGSDDAEIVRQYKAVTVLQHLVRQNMAMQFSYAADPAQKPCLKDDSKGLRRGIPILH